MRVPWAPAALAFATACAAGCIVVTGGSSGYSASEAGTPGASCKSSADCPGQVCCYAIDAGPTPACAASCPSSLESCTRASDCGEAGACLVQSCQVDTEGFQVNVSVTTCGVVSFCTQ
jgi:hypothetical protein